MSAENAFFGVLSRRGYENPDAVDIEQSWRTGREDVGSFMKLLGFDNSNLLHMLEIGCDLGRMTHHFSSQGFLLGLLVTAPLSGTPFAHKSRYFA